MFRHRTLALAGLLGASTLLAGCFNSEDSPTATGSSGSDEEAIQAVTFEEMGDYTNVDVFYYDDGGNDPSLAPINTHFWRRELLRFDREIQIVISRPQGEPATADVEVTGNAVGLLHLFACAGDSLAHLTKDFDDRGVRKLYFERVRPRAPRHRGWKLQALSGVEIASEGATRQIVSVRLQAGDVDETITGVSDLVPIEELTRLPAAAQIAVTVETGDASDAVFLHIRRELRIPLQSNGDGTFTGVFWTTDRPGPRHLVVDVLSDGTLYDDTEPYDNLAWGIPYLVAPPGGGPGDLP